MSPSLDRLTSLAENIHLAALAISLERIQPSGGQPMAKRWIRFSLFHS
jgi:hypothetical protein